MKQSTSSCVETFFDDDELEVSDILLDLPNLIYESEFRRRFTVRWAVKRRRSANDSGPSSPPRRRLCPSPSLQKTFQGESETERKPKVKAEASSPATPLSFSPSESDDKSKHSRNKVSKKRTREEWLEITEALIQRRELLRGEIETVKSYYNKLKALNLELKAKKQELRFSHEKPHTEEEISKSRSSQHISTVVEPQIHCMVLLHHHHQQQSYESHASENFQYPFGHVSTLVSSSGSRLSNNANHTGPLGIPDLNVAAEETFRVDSSQPLDHSRALTDNRTRAAEARRRRMVRIKEMKSSFALPR